MASSSGRYVFFSSLKEGDYLFPFLPDASARLYNVRNSIGIGATYDSKTKEYTDRIKKYLIFIKSMQENLRSNELAFLDQQKSLLAKDENKEFQELYNGFSTGQVKYNELMRAFNLLFQDQEHYEAALTSETTRMRRVKNAYLEFNNRSFINELYETDYKRYSAILASELKKKSQTASKNDELIDEYKYSLSEQIAYKANKVLQELNNNEEFITKLCNAFSENLEMKDSDFKSIIINLVANEVVNSKIESNFNTIVDNILTKANNNLLELVNSVGDAEFSRIVVPDPQILESLALTTDNSLKDYLELIDQQSFKKIAGKYPETKDLIDKLNNAQLTLEEKDEVLKETSRVLRRAIRKKASDILHRPIKERMRKKVFNTELLNVKDFITSTQIESQLNVALKGVHFSHDMIGEIMASSDVRERLKEVIVNNLPGISISFKSDIRFSTGYVGSNDIQISDRHFNKIKNIIDKVIQDHYSDFLLMYKDASGGQTNVKEAMDVYKQWLNRMKQSLDTLIDSDEELKHRFHDRTLLYKELYNTFSNSISVKDYSLYNNELGFHGGSLGSKTAPQQVIDNITQMYTLGGISNVDAEEILFAVINCGEAMIGSGIKPSLEQYLLGGAALIMFDDSFAASDDFLEKLVDNFKGQRIVNLYRINQYFVPASIVLEEIYNNLSEVYTHTCADLIISNISQHNRVTITNNITYNPDLKGTPEKKAEAMSNYALSHISIQFSFMGGLLDVMEKELSNITHIR